MKITIISDRFFGAGFLRQCQAQERVMETSKLTLTAKRSAQDSDSLREDERNIIPSKSARAEQSKHTPI